MKKLLTVFTIFLALSLSFTTPTFAWNQRAPLPLQQCSIHAPFGVPQSSRPVEFICRQAYLVGFDPSSKIPEYVEWTLTPQAALGCVPRSNAFETDMSVRGSATPQDYARSGYDKGHMAPDGDQSWDQQVELESFLMTNMTPQAGSLNRGIWKLLETSFRGWVYQQNRPFTAISGAIYGPSDKRIGSGVVVPHAFYKIVIDDQTGYVAGWYFPHVPPYPNLGNDLTRYRRSVVQIEQEAGVRFGLPTNAQEVPVGKEWPVNFAALTQAKKMKCGPNASVD